MSKFINVIRGLSSLAKFLSNQRFYSCKVCTDYYQVLNLPKNCTAKQIKDAYIRLSKQYHPDKSKNSEAHKKFLEIGEAYKILSKPNLRWDYDLSLHNTNYAGRAVKNDSDDPIFYANRDRNQDAYYRSKPYYGIRGIKRVSNATIVVLCVFVGVIGVGLQILAIRNSFTLNRERMAAVYYKTQLDLTETQELADKNGTKMQIELFKQRMKANGYEGFTEESDDETES